MAQGGASVHAFARGVRRVVLDGAALANLNAWSDAGRIGPVSALLSRAGALGDPERMAAGELVRLAGTGVVDPEQSIRYARLHRGASR